MLQSLSGKLNRLNDVREIGDEVAAELRTLIPYHNCRVFVVEGSELVPIAFRGELTSDAARPLDLLRGRVGEGITGHCAQVGESLLVGDAASCEFARPVPGTATIEESLLAVPLRYGARVVGVIVVSKLGLNQFDEDDLRLLEVLAGHAAVAVENARLYESARREAESATALLEFARALAVSDSLESVFAQVAELTSSLIGSPRTSVWLEGGDGWVTARALHGYDDPSVRLSVASRRFAAEQSRLLAGGREAFLLPPEELAQIDPSPHAPNASYAVAPMEIDGRVGFMVAVVPQPEAFGESELRLFGGLAHQAKLAIANASSYEGLERTFVSTVEALANALEANDEYTSTHARWITDLSLRVGRSLGLDDAALKRLELGALLHDIGKIGIPNEILTKPGRLTADERAVIERHPELGERIIAPIDRLQGVRPVVLHCHERWDGRGYPHSLAGEAIPVESRIIFVCDAYHAMTSDRPYRRRLSHPEAVRRLVEGAGTQFDPRVVAACIEVVNEAVKPRLVRD
jgi:HD-GYP domain-containing protein (c-di-GMP phosphodiesterase class II)